ncbi:hypothetical protein DL765_008117 [Monosporascus sp. GIB2]|nr:hypothetical protein DL765_008117 [Monosporascus sp. GIB2]
MLTPTRSHIRRFIVSGLMFSKAQAAATPPSSSALLDSLPVREIAGVRVVDTPLVRDAELFARQHSTDVLYKHVMRSMLFGTLITQHNETLASTVDPETHAVAVLLHDVGLDRRPNSPFISGDRRFEVDGAFAARAFLEAHEEGRRWQDDGRMQLVWDSIALHTERSIAYYKEPAVQVVSKGIALDFSGPGFSVTEAEYAAVVDRFPKDGLRDGLNDTLVWLCETKPATTYGELLRVFLRVALLPVYKEARLSLLTAFSAII